MTAAEKAMTRSSRAKDTPASPPGAPSCGFRPCCRSWCFPQFLPRLRLRTASSPFVVVTVIWQFTNVWNDFLFGVSFADYDSMPMTVALNNLVSSSTGVKEYNVHGDHGAPESP